MCEALLTVPSKCHLLTHTRAVKCTQRSTSHTEQLQGCDSPTGGLGWKSLVSASFFFPSLLSFSSLSQVHALLLVSSTEDKREGGGEGERRVAERGRGRGGPCVRMGERLPCAMWSDLIERHGANKSFQYTCRFPVKNRQQRLSPKLFRYRINVHLVNYMTSGPYGRASQQDRWTEYQNKKLNRAFPQAQMGCGQTDKCRLVKCQIRYYPRKKNLLIIKLSCRSSVTPIGCL